MKRNGYVLLLLICSLLLISSNRRVTSSEIDVKLIDDLVGDWKGDVSGTYPAYGEVTITEKNKYLYFKDEKLQIINTLGNTVFTQTNEAKPFYYDFEVRENKLTVYQSYSVSKGTTGGELAPIEYMRE